MRSGFIVGDGRGLPNFFNPSSKPEIGVVFSNQAGCGGDLVKIIDRKREGVNPLLDGRTVCHVDGRP